MPKKVPDTEKNREICKSNCGACPTFTGNSLNEVEPGVLFCSRGASKKPQEEIEDEGCNCPACAVFGEYDLEGGWFCIHGVEGR